MNAIKLCFLSSLVTLAGCSLNLPVATDASERDLNGNFNGKLVLAANNAYGNCKHNFQRAYMDVTNGEGQIGPEGPAGKGFISSDGNFRIEVPRANGATRRVYGGNLTSSKGRVIIARPTRGKSTDCSIGLSIEKVE